MSSDTTELRQLAKTSAYHLFRQHNGKGWGILLLDDGSCDRGTVVAANMPGQEARERLASLRRAELARTVAPAQRSR